MIDLFNQPFYESHGRENSKHSEEIYEAQAVRLSRNTRIILICLTEGQEITGLKCMQGLRTNAGETAVMIEFRKRLMEIRSAGITLNDKIGSSGCKTWTLPESEFEKAKQLLK